MSLFSRLMWYTFFLLVAILGFTTLVVSQWTVHSFEDRLTVQAQTSVGVLSRALSRFDLSVEDDRKEACTWLSSVPDTLEFRSVELIDELGNRRCYQTNTPQPPVAPSWFIDNLEIQITPATQPIQQGWVTWELIGIPYEANAYDELWNLAINTFWGVFALLVSASIGGFWPFRGYWISAPGGYPSKEYWRAALHKDSYPQHD